MFRGDGLSQLTVRLELIELGVHLDRRVREMKLK